jgi:hypothetical protein
LLEQSAVVVQLPPLVFAYWQVPLFGMTGQAAELAPTVQPVMPVVVWQKFGNGLHPALEEQTPLGTLAVFW